MPNATYYAGPYIKSAAKKGHVKAQHLMGAFWFDYATSGSYNEFMQGIPAACGWFAVAAANGDKVAGAKLDLIRKKMRPRAKHDEAFAMVLNNCNHNAIDFVNEFKR